MKTSLLDYDLPAELIASRPPAERDGGRMLCVNKDSLLHGWVRDFVQNLEPGDLLVINDTRVRKARLICRRSATVDSGGGARVELLILHARSTEIWAALGKANRPLRVGDTLIAAGVEIEVIERDGQGTLYLRVQGDLDEALEKSGMMPIPPYLDRPSDQEDDMRYQTVFADEIGSAAAPTAGLHITPAMLKLAEERGVEIARVTLHVGVGTFRPVTADDLDQHAMHTEQISVNERVSEAIVRTRERRGRVVAVGTTVVRALESVRDESRLGLIKPAQDSTRLLIQPGYRFTVVDALLTNFHQPKSTLLALVSAFAGYERTMAAYQSAIESKYRFLSYGDAMWLPQPFHNGAQ